MSEKISVAVRVRPLNSAENAKGSASAWSVDPVACTLQEAGSKTAPKFAMDHVFDNTFSTDDVYAATTQGLIHSVVGGFNGTVFAYGQTSSGKTHTMRGTSEDPGLIPKAVREVFNRITASPGREFLLRVAYLELYNEEFRDLLAPNSNHKLQLHEDPARGIFVAGLHEELVTSPEQVLKVMDVGEASRHVGETAMNARSSRSHTIFRMVVESRDSTQSEDACDAVRVSTLHLVDLAGSERIAKTGAEGVRMKEGVMINKSLSVLALVINKLSEGKTKGHIPYRDSKLTRILQPALGGNAKTLIICCVTAASIHAEETRGTLQFATRAKSVTNNAHVNEVLTDEALLKRQQKEILSLRKKLAASGETVDEGLLNELRREMMMVEQEKTRMEMELHEERAQQKAKQQELEEQSRKIENLEKFIHSDKGSADDPTEDGSKPKTKKENRRTTWCPAPGGGARGPLFALSTNQHLKPLSGFGKPLASPAPLLEESLVEETDDAAEPGPAALPAMASVSEGSEQEGEELRARIKELEAENKWMQQLVEKIPDETQVDSAHDADAAVIGELQKEVQELMHELDTAKAQLADATSQADTLNGSLDDAMTALDQTMNEKAELENMVQDIQEQLRVVSASLETQSCDMEARLKGLTSELENAKATSMDMKEKLDEAKQRAATLYDKNETLEVHIEELEKRKRAPLYDKKNEAIIKDLNEKISEMQLELDQHSVDASSSQVEVLQLTQSLETLKVQATSDAAQAALDKQQAEETAAKLTEQIGSLQASIAELEAAVQESNMATESARSRLQEQEVYNQESLGRIQSLEGELAELQQSYQTTEQQRQDLEKELRCSSGKTQEIRSLLDEAQARAKEEAAASVNMQADLSQLQSDMEAALNDMRAAQSKAAEAEEAAVAAEERASVAEATLQVSKQDAQEAQARLAHAQADLETFKSKSGDEMASLRADVNRLTKEAKATASAPKGLQREVDGLKRDLDKAREKCAAAEGKLKTALAEKSTATAEKANLEREVKHLRSQSSALTKQESQVDKKQASLQKDLLEANKQISNLEASLQQQSAELEALQRLSQDTEKALAEASQQVENMSGDLTAAHEENERIQFELCEAQAELPKIGELEKELEEIAAQLNDVTFQVEEERAESIAQKEALTARIAAAEANVLADNESSKGQHKALSQSLNAAQEQADQLSSEVSRLSREVEEANAREAEAMEKLQQVTLAAEEQMSRGDAAAQRANAAATESSALNTKMEALVAERASAWAELDALRAQLQEAGQQLETAVQERPHLGGAEDPELLAPDTNLEATIISLQGHMCELETGLETERAEGVNVVADMHMLQARLNAPHPELEGLKVQLKTMEQSAHKATEVEAGLRTQLTEAEGSRQHLMAKISGLEDQAADAESLLLKHDDLKVQLEHAKNAATQQESEMSECKQRLVEAESLQARLQFEMDETRAQLEDVNVTKQLAQADAEQAKAQLATMQQHAQESAQEVARLESVVTDLQAELQAQKAAGEESSCGMADADARMAALTEEVSLAHAERARALDVQLAAASELEEQLECSRVRDAQIAQMEELMQTQTMEIEELKSLALQEESRIQQVLSVEMKAREQDLCNQVSELQLQASAVAEHHSSELEDMRSALDDTKEELRICGEDAKLSKQEALEMAEKLAELQASRLTTETTNVVDYPSAEKELERQMAMVQLQRRFDKMESEKNITKEKLCELTKEHRKICAQRDEHIAAMTSLLQEKDRTSAELEELRCELADITSAVPPSPVQMMTIPEEAPESELVLKSNQYQILLNKHAELTQYTKRKNLEMRRMLNCYKTLKTTFEKSGGSGSAFDAKSREADLQFDLKTAEQRYQQLKAELEITRDTVKTLEGMQPKRSDCMPLAARSDVSNGRQTRSQTQQNGKGAHALVASSGGALEKENKVFN